MIVPNSGEETKNDLKIKNNSEGEDKPMVDEKIASLMNEIDTYKQAIEDAKDALASAEMELDAALEKEFNQ